MSEFEPGQTFHVPFPFIRGEYEDCEETPDPDECGRMFRTIKRKTWNPGVDGFYETRDGCTVGVAHGEGFMVLTVVSVHKPGHFPTRIFYTRTWINPDGKAFGRANCRVCIQEKFRRLIKGYAHDYAVDEAEGEAAA